MFRACLILSLCTAAFASTQTYRYTGNPMTDCNGSLPANEHCPANYASDYLIASITFSAPLPPGLSKANEISNLAAWSFGDALGYASYASSDANAASELTSLEISTNSAGIITAWTMTVEVGHAGQPGATALGINNPTITGGGNNLPLADFLVSNGGNSAPAGWNVGNTLPGLWTQVSPVVTYHYTGSPFSTCSFGSCPAYFTSDYIIASLTFNASLAPNLTSANELTSPSLVAWTIGDALGYFSYSSSDTNAASELTTLTLSTDAGGNIQGYTTFAGVGPTGGAVNPTQEPNGSVVADFVQIDYGTGAEWDAITAVPGQWTQTQSGITYQVNRTGIGFDHGTVTGIIQTDGTIGTLTAANIVGWDLVAYDGLANTYGLTGGTGGNSTLAITGTGLSATATQLSYNFGASGTMQISNSSAGWALGVTSGNNTFEELFPVALNGNAAPELGTQVIGSLPAAASFTPNAFFNGEQPSSVSGWDFLQLASGSPFGYYAFLQGSASTSSAWLFHADLGYEYLIPAPSGGAYIYDLASNHWWYTSSSLFPYLYDFTLNVWLYYFPNTAKAGHYTTNPRYFANMTSKAIFTM